ncbi:hypothetical protein KW404_21715, partial [Xanthomonas vasicola pv. vasculorum]|uniref:hypothetical protein n=1 Tax=Xanthomonas vasicola TaxID=56459 RepID=UPI001C46341D
MLASAERFSERVVQLLLDVFGDFLANLLGVLVDVFGVGSDKLVLREPLNNSPQIRDTTRLMLRSDPCN